MIAIAALHYIYIYIYIYISYLLFSSHDISLSFTHTHACIPAQQYSILSQFFPIISNFSYHYFLPSSLCHSHTNSHTPSTYTHTHTHIHTHIYIYIYIYIYHSPLLLHTQPSTFSYANSHFLSSLLSLSSSLSPFLFHSHRLSPFSHVQSDTHVPINF